MTRNEQKDEIQQKAVELSVKYPFLCLQWATGVGKTYAAAKIVENFLKVKSDATGYLICKESTHRKNWKDDLIKHKKDSILDNTKTILYASIHRESQKADYIILDECHALTTKRIQSLRGILKKNTRIIFLSATIPKEKKQLMSRLCKSIHYYTIDLNKSFELNLLPKPKVVVHRIHLMKKVDGKVWDFKYRKPTRGSKVIKYCSHKDLFMTLKNYPKTCGIVVQGSEQDYYDLVTKQMAYYDSLSEDIKLPYPVREGCRNKYLNLGTIRKRFIAEVKTNRVIALVDVFRLLNSRFICFTGSVEQAIEVGSKSAVHSKNDKGVNQELIDCFNRGECNELFAVKMLREGINLFDIEKGIITQLDSGIGSFFQMLGRCLRHDFPELHMFVLQNTQDVVYFKKSMKSFNDKYIKYKDYDIVL